jgi:hypothetical protein
MTTEDDIDRLLRTLPAPQPDRDSQARANALLRAHIAADADQVAGPGRAARPASSMRPGVHARAARRPQWPRMPVAVGLLSAAAIAAVMLLVAGGTDPTARPDAAVAAGMEQLAQAAGRNAPDPVFGPHDAWYVRSTELSDRSFGGTQSAIGGPVSPVVRVQQPVLREAWFSNDGPGRLLTRYTGRRTILSGDAKNIPKEFDDLEPTPQGDVLDSGITVNFGTSLTLAQAAKLPTEPGALLARIRDVARGKGQSPDSEAFTVVGDALRESPILRRLRVALLRTVALIPGVSIAHGRDANGREAVIAERNESGGRSQLLLNPEDGTLLEERTYSDGADGVSTGTLTYRSTLDATAVVHSVHDRP